MRQPFYVTREGTDPERVSIWKLAPERKTVGIGKETRTYFHGTMRGQHVIDMSLTAFQFVFKYAPPADKVVEVTLPELTATPLREHEMASLFARQG